MALDLLKWDAGMGVDASWLATRLAEECRPCVDVAYDEDRHKVVLDAAHYEVDSGLVVECGGKTFRLHVEAEEIDAPSVEDPEIDS